jgi:hypothetical protein
MIKMILRRYHIDLIGITLFAMAILINHSSYAIASTVSITYNQVSAIDQTDLLFHGLEAIGSGEQRVNISSSEWASAKTSIRELLYLNFPGIDFYFMPYLLGVFSANGSLPPPTVNGNLTAEYTFSISSNDPMIKQVKGDIHFGGSYSTAYARYTDSSTIYDQQGTEVWSNGSGYVVFPFNVNESYRLVHSFSWWSMNQQSMPIGQEGASSWVAISAPAFEPVPLPPTVLLLGSGLAGLAAFRQKLRA